MDETGKRIHDTLSELHEELRGADNLDDAARAELQTAIEEIRATLAASEPHERSLLDRLNDYSLRIEGSHPRLSEAVGRLALTLSELGI